jgi:N-methylhydantoinase B
MATFETVRHQVKRATGGYASIPDADPITTEVIRHGLDAAADQMRVTLRRTAFSPVIYDMTDFAAALYDPEIRLLAQAQALPLFLGTLSFCIERSVDKVGGAEALEPGDSLFTTYGYDTGSHPQDAVIIVPAFPGGELVGYAAVKAHHMDIGAKEPYCTDTLDNFQEGTIFPSVKLYQAGVRQEDLYRTLVANSRMPQALVGDLHGQIAAAHTGLAAYFQLIDRYGIETVRTSTERMMDHGEALIRHFFDSIPDGRYVGQGALDNNGIDDETVPFEVAVEIRGSDVVIDYTNSATQQRGPINCPMPSSVSAARIAIMMFAGGNQSANEGHFRPIEVRTLPGTIFHPIPPVPIYMCGWPVMQAVDVIHKALSEAMPEAVPAANGGDLCAIVYWGTTEDGNFWADAADHYVGQGASFESDGGAPLMHISCSGIRNSPIEIIEARRPILTEQFEYAPDSGGAGRFRGGLGVDIRYRALRDFYTTMPWERMKIPPWGLHGGQPARAHSFRVQYPSGAVGGSAKVTGLHIPAGAVLELNTSGGGGFGPPNERDVSAIHADVREGYITEGAARRDYPHAFSTSGPGQIATM